MKTLITMILFLSLNCLAQINSVSKNRKIQSQNQTINNYEIADINIPEVRDDTVFIELMGRSFLYSLGYQKNIKREFAFGVAFSYVSGVIKSDLADTSVRAYSVPIYANYYFTKHRQHRYYLTGGINVFSFNAVAKLNQKTQDNLNATVSAINNSEEAQSFSDDGSNLVNLPDLKLEGSATIVLPHLGLGYEFHSRNGFFAAANAYVIYAIDKVVPMIGLGAGYSF